MEKKSIRVDVIKRGTTREKPLGCFYKCQITIGGSPVLVQSLNKLLFHHTIEGDVGEIRDEGVTCSPADASTASEVE